MAEAIAARAMPGYQPAGTGRHAEFMGWRPSDMVREFLTLGGDTAVPRDPVRLAEGAFHTTSDFPLRLSAAANKMLLAAYQPAAPIHRQIFLRRNFRDFKPHRHHRIGNMLGRVRNWSLARKSVDQCADRSAAAIVARTRWPILSSAPASICKTISSVRRSTRAVGSSDGAGVPKISEIRFTDAL